MSNNHSKMTANATWLALSEENRLLRLELDALRADKYAIRERQIAASAVANGKDKPSPYFSAVFIHDSQVRRMRFEAADIDEAKALAARWGAGVEGEVNMDPSDAPEVPAAYNLTKARQMLGGVSRSQIYVWLTLGQVERLPGTRRVLITRESIEKFQRRKAA